MEHAPENSLPPFGPYQPFTHEEIDRMVPDQRPDILKIRMLSIREDLLRPVSIESGITENGQITAKINIPERLPTDGQLLTYLFAKSAYHTEAAKRAARHANTTENSFQTMMQMQTDIAIRTLRGENKANHLITAAAREILSEEMNDLVGSVRYNAEKSIPDWFALKQARVKYAQMIVESLEKRFPDNIQKYEPD